MRLPWLPRRPPQVAQAVGALLRHALPHRPLPGHATHRMVALRQAQTRLCAAAPHRAAPPRHAAPHRAAPHRAS
eukprot:4358401-Prymnesium_polylepis.1